MPTSCSHEEIRRHLEQYLRGEEMLQQFDAWLITLPLDEIERSSDEETRELLADLHLRLAEYSHGDWAEDQLRRLLRPLTQPGVVAVDLDLEQLNVTVAALEPANTPVERE